MDSEKRRIIEAGYLSEEDEMMKIKALLIKKEIRKKGQG